MAFPGGFIPEMYHAWYYASTPGTVAEHDGVVRGEAELPCRIVDERDRPAQAPGGR
jgi:hypothetical protein